jgi:DNA-binding PadR family transcriptional regulator
MRKLSELEGAVLGLVATHQPVTPYQIRKIFAQCPNQHWSASAGAIYPLMDRLATARLVSVREHTQGDRIGQHFSITATGKKRLRSWILAADHGRLTTIADLVRLRISFIRELTENERRAFLADMIAKIGAEAERMAREERTLRDGNDPIEYLIARGGLIMAQARLTWLHEVKQRLGL